MIDYKQFDGHTPGPWEHSVGTDGNGAVVYCEDTGTVANVPIDLTGYSTNAALIAAAPDLLADNKRLREALEFAVDMQNSVEAALPDGYGSARNTIAWMDNARAALGDK